MIQQIDRQVDVNRIIDIFSELTIISGVSGMETKVNQFVRDFLQGKAVSIHEDDAANRFGGNSGNLILVPNHFNPQKPALALMAHMDTVRDTSLTKVKVSEKALQSAGNTQLGADNRLGMVHLLAFMERISENPSQTNFIVVFTVAEEAGMLGAKALDLSPWNVRQALVFDSSLRPGKYISQSAGMVLFDVAFKGVAAHSAVSNGAGIHAVLMASEAVASILNEPSRNQITRNIGKIEGGEATNVVPAHCRFEGEIRGFTIETINIEINRYQEICSEIALKHGGEVIWNQQTDFEPYTIGLEIRESLEQIFSVSSLNPEPVVYSGGSDANVLNALGIPSINIGIGAQNPHSDNELVLIEDIVAIQRVLQTLETRDF